jgi:CRP-like cAMP-binding protein
MSQRLDDQLTPELLRGIALFGALSDEVLALLAATLPTTRYQSGDVVFREGDSAREMFVVLEGEIEVLKRSRRGSEARVAMLGPGDTLGEMAFVDMQNRSATVRAVAPTRLVCVTAEAMESLYRADLRAYTLIVLNVARDLSRRLRVTDGILADFVANVLDEFVQRARTGRPPPP